MLVQFTGGDIFLNLINYSFPHPHLVPPYAFQLQHILDVLFNKLHSKGIRRQVRHTEVISKSEEQTLWESHILGVENPKTLQNAVFYFGEDIVSTRRH